MSLENFAKEYILTKKDEAEKHGFTLGVEVMGNNMYISATDNIQIPKHISNLDFNLAKLGYLCAEAPLPVGLQDVRTRFKNFENTLPKTLTYEGNKQINVKLDCFPF